MKEGENMINGLQHSNTIKGIVMKTINHIQYKKVVRKLKTMPLHNTKEAFAMAKVISRLTSKQQFLALADRGLYREEIHHVLTANDMTFNDVEEMFEEFKELNIPYKFPKV